MNLKISPKEYKKQNWIIHELASDFILQDCWRLPLKTSEPFEKVLDFFFTVDPTSSSRLVKALFAIRLAAGKLLRWDEGTVSIPGTGELSIAERLKGAGPTSFAVPKDGPFSKFHAVYLRDNEALLEISNRTIFALIHLGKKNDEVWLGIYTKSHGALSDVYMGLIKPFRHLVVYPRWFKCLEAEWRAP